MVPTSPRNHWSLLMDPCTHYKTQLILLKLNQSSNDSALIRNHWKLLETYFMKMLTVLLSVQAFQSKNLTNMLELIQPRPPDGSSSHH